MLKTIKEIKIYGIILALVFAAFVTASFATRTNIRNNNVRQVNVYFWNQSLYMLEREPRSISRTSDEEMISELLGILAKGPSNKNLAKTIPDGIKLVQGQFVGNKSLLELEFESDGVDLTWETTLFFKSALVWTMTELEFVKDLHIYLDGEELLQQGGEPSGILNRNNVVINSPISPFVSDTLRVRLYFTNNTGGGLVSEERVIQVIKATPDQYTEKHVVEQLIAGPSKPEHFSTVPQETKVREVNTEDGICYVNLSSEFITKFVGNVADQKIAVYSIVNSLTELSGVNKVQFLIDSKKSEGFKGGFDLSKPVERDEELIIQ